MQCLTVRGDYFAVSICFQNPFIAFIPLGDQLEWISAVKTSKEDFSVNFWCV